MRIKSVKINNYKSFGKEDNLLKIQEINILIGKNESGKSNLLDALGQINYKGLIKGIDQNKNFNSNEEIVLSINLESEKIPDSTLTFYENGDIYIENGLSDFLINNIDLKSKITYLVDNQLPNIWNSNTLFSYYLALLSDLKNYHTKIVRIQEDKVDNILKIMENRGYDELYKNFQETLEYLKMVYDQFPKIVSVDNNQLKTSYSKAFICDSKSKIEELERFIQCLGFSIEDIRKYWELPNQAQQSNFEDDLKRKAIDFSREFNEFYNQKKVLIIPCLEDRGLFINISTEKYKIGIEERSNGLRWYLNMFIQLKYKQITSNFNNFVVLMDEPGVFLHVNAQEELKKLFEKFVENGNQIIYTTQSPFMIYSENLDRIRILLKDEIGNTHISNCFYAMPHKLQGGEESMMPIMKALGMNMNFNLFIENKKKHIITEGITDFNFLNAYLTQKQMVSNYVILPSNGVSKINNIVSILKGW